MDDPEKLASLCTQDTGQRQTNYFFILLCTEGAASVIGLYGGVEHVITALKTHPNNPELCATCCHALWSLAVVGLYLTR